MNGNKYKKGKMSAMTMLALAFFMTMFLGSGKEVKAASPDENGIVSYTFECQDEAGNVITSAKPGDTVYAVCVVTLQDGWSVDEGTFPAPYYNGEKVSDNGDWKFTRLESSKWQDTEYAIGKSCCTIPDYVQDGNLSFKLETFFNAPDDPVGMHTVYSQLIMNISIGDSAPSVSGNVPSKQENPPASDSADSDTVTNVEEKQADTVQIAGGKTLVSTVGGIYSAKTMNGVAVTTPEEVVAGAAGLTDEDIKNNTNMRFYVCDDKPTKYYKTVADDLGKKIAACFHMDLYSIDRKGIVTAIRNTSEPINVVMGVPAALAKEENKFSVITYVNGQLYVMEDKDTNPNTITIDTNVFGVYAIIY